VFNYFTIGQRGYNIVNTYVSLKKPVKDMACPAQFLFFTMADNVLNGHTITIA
jgi:hypothetical protein